EARTRLCTRPILAPLSDFQLASPAHFSANFSGGEGAAAPTRGLRLWVLDREPGPLQAIHIVDFRSLKEWRALRIHDDLDIALLNDRVVIGHLRLEGHPVLIPVTTAALHVDPQADNVFLIRHQFLDLLLRNRRDRNHRVPPPVARLSFEDLPGMI